MADFVIHRNDDNQEKYFQEERPSPGILVLLLDRPRKKNAITGAMYLDLADAMDRAAMDESVTCLVLTGKGDYFSSGADLTDESWTPDPEHKMETSPAAIFMKALSHFPKLVVAAVNGPAIGIAVTLLCHVDLAYAAPHATFWTPFLRMAIVPEYASSALFPLTMGRSKASELLFLGKKFTATEAQASHLISEIIPTDRLLTEVLLRLEDMLAKPLVQKSVVAFKALMKSQRLREVDDVIKAEFRAFDDRIAEGDVAFAIGQLLQSRL
uniref:Enyol-CoA hydratase n=1 Tax=Nannochloropsis gaditana (strain CCMP526) TaxID=1093141 RepID=I2CR30_NANGC